MINSFIETFLNLEDDKKNKLMNLLSNFINPIKIYLIVVVLLLLIMCISNYYIYKALKINKIT
jgi:Fe2+ transport system protein B